MRRRVAGEDAVDSVVPVGRGKLEAKEKSRIKSFCTIGPLRLSSQFLCSLRHHSQA